MKDSMRSSDTHSPFQSSQTNNISACLCLAEPSCAPKSCEGGEAREKQDCIPMPNIGDRTHRGAEKFVQEADQASSVLDQQKEKTLIEAYWKSHEGYCLVCKIPIALEDQYCPTHARELSEMLDDLSVRSSASTD